MESETEMIWKCEVISQDMTQFQFTDDIILE